MGNSREIIDTEVIHNSNKEVTNYELLHLPSLVRRVMALIIDSLVILLVFSTLSVLINILGEIPNVIRGFFLIFMIYLYDPILTSFYGATIGHRIMNLTLRKFDDQSSNISIGNALLRFVIKILLGWISFITVTSNKNKRAIHDLASGSIVIYRKN
jgi:uncharacterized RDD family membrane protein YckC